MNLAGKFGSNISLEKVDNLVFIKDNCPTLVNEVIPTLRSLVITRNECAQNSRYLKIGTVKRVGGSDSFTLYKIKANQYEQSPVELIPASL